MDRNPIAPENVRNHDVAHLLTETFQEHVRYFKYPLNTTKSVHTYTLDYILQNQENRVLEVQQHGHEASYELEAMTNVETTLMHQHALHLIAEHDLKESKCTMEHLLLKRKKIIDCLSNDDINQYNLLKHSDLFGCAIKQYLDFRVNPELHTCRPTCQDDERLTSHTLLAVPGPISKQQPKKDSLTPVSSKKSLVADPALVTFTNYKLGRTYKKTIKLRNCSSSTVAFTYRVSKEFKVQMVTHSNRLAPGMFAQFCISYEPTVYNNLNEFITFKCSDGTTTTVHLRSDRVPPKISCLVYNLLTDSIEQLVPKHGQLSRRRWTALNFTIDLGTTLLGSFCLCGLIMKNDGQEGKFFVTTEQEWHFQEIQDESTRTMELNVGDFTIFPTYFEVGADEMAQIFVMYVPQQTGLHMEKIIITCNNNTKQEIDLIADCVTFDSNRIKVDLFLAEQNFVDHNINLTGDSNTPIFFVLSVTNDSSLPLKYQWVVERILDDAHLIPIEPDWFQILNQVKWLLPCSVTDFMVRLTPKTDIAGTYALQLSLFIIDIPIHSLFSNDDAASDCSCIDLSQNIANQDVFICKLKLICHVKLPIPAPIECQCKHMEDDNKSESEARAIFSRNFICFGLVPEGVEVSKTVTILNLTNASLRWRILEVQCHPDLTFTTLEGNHLRPSCGAFTKKCIITYTVQAKEPRKHISILLLLCFKPQEDTILDFSLCLVTYQVVPIGVSLFVEATKLPLICPKEVLYINKPHKEQFFAKNNGNVPGCFYFLKPTGYGAQSLKLKVQPQSGIVEMGQRVPLTIEIIPLEMGVFEDVYVPCFTGDKNNMISLKIICVVDYINVYVYLPDNFSGYRRVEWPPRSHPDFDMFAGETTTLKGEDHASDKYADNVDTKLWDLISKDCIAANYPTVNISKITVKKCTKVTFFIENASPLHGKIAVWAVNYGPDPHRKERILVRCGVKSQASYWENHCNEGYGIIIEPEPNSCDIYPHEVVSIDLNIYANTWGTYLEEIMVEVEDLVPFCFNLIVDVVGLPLEFPSLSNRRLRELSLRFGPIAYGSKPVEKLLRVTNISSVPIQAEWYLFSCGGTSVERKSKLPFNLVLGTIDDTGSNKMNLVITPQHYGQQNQSYFEIHPCTINLDKQSTLMLAVTFNCHLIKAQPEKMVLKQNLVAYTYVQDNFKESYYLRKSGSELSPLKLKIVAQMEWPKLTLESDAESTQFHIFVNDWLLCRPINDNTKRCLKFRNSIDAKILCSIRIDRPFVLNWIKTTNINYNCNETISVSRGHYVEVDVKFDVSTTELMSIADHIYDYDKDHHGHSRQEEDYVRTMKKYLRIDYPEVNQQLVPLDIKLYYPQIRVKPQSINFGTVLVFNTKKTLISVYNLAGGAVNFEVYKPTLSREFEIRPAVGVLKEYRGEFFDVSVYFTPKEPRYYEEILRVQTNIVNYYINVPICGYGSNDEKYAV